MNYFDNLSDLKTNKLLLKTGANTFFIAYWSFSETPTKLREKFLPILKICSKVIIVSNEIIFGINNNKYFEDLSFSLIKSHKYTRLDLPIEYNYSYKNTYFRKHSIHLYTRKS